MVKEQYLKEIEESFTVAIEKSKLANISNEDLITILNNLLEE